MLNASRRRSRNVGSNVRREAEWRTLATSYFLVAIASSTPRAIAPSGVHWVTARAP